MKKNGTMIRIAVLMLVLTLATACFVGGTFAKYSTDTVLSGAATVADWSITVNEQEITVAEEPTITFNLFDSLYKLDTDDNVSEDPNNAVKAEGALIAPGTGGKFVMTIKNVAEVDAKYDIDFVVDLESVPLQFSTDNSAWEDTIADLDVTEAALAMGATSSVTLYWRWNPDSVDSADTALGIAATKATPSVTATITVYQDIPVYEAP